MPPASLQRCDKTAQQFLSSTFKERTPFSAMIAWPVMRGLGIGLCMMPVTTAGMNTVPMHLMGKGSALGNVMRQVLASLDIAMFTSIMQWFSTMPI